MEQAVHETWWYDDEREEVIDITIPKGKTAAASYPVCRIATNGMLRSQIAAVGERIAQLPQVEAECDILRVKVALRNAALDAAYDVIKTHLSGYSGLLLDIERLVEESADGQM